MEALLSVRSLVKEFPVTGGKVVHAVNDVSFEIGRAECVALVGESGSGKTTVGRCILGLEEVTRGEISFRGQDLTKLSSREFRRRRADLQMVFQEPTDSLNPQMTVRKIIEEPVLLQARLSPKERAARVDHLVEMVRIPKNYLDRFPHQLSAGQAQRVGIARAMATRPSVVVLDEPTSVLDISVRADIIQLLKDLQREEGLSYLFISHDLLAVRAIADRVAVMYLGKVVEYGPTEEVFDRPLHPYTRALMTSVLYPDSEVRFERFMLEGEIPSPIDLPQGCHLAGRCPLATQACQDGVPPFREHLPGHLASCIRIGEELTSPEIAR